MRWFPIRCANLPWICFHSVWIVRKWHCIQTETLSQVLDTPKEKTNPFMERNEHSYRKYQAEEIYLLAIHTYDNHVSYINIGVAFVLFEQQHLNEREFAAVALILFLHSPHYTPWQQKNLFIHLICKRITIIYSVPLIRRNVFLCIFMHVMHALCVTLLLSFFFC